MIFDGRPVSIQWAYAVGFASNGFFLFASDIGTSDSVGTGCHGRWTGKETSGRRPRRQSDSWSNLFLVWASRLREFIL